MGKFLIGFVVGAAVGGVAVYVLSQREQGGAASSGNGVQAGGGLVQQVNARIQQALAVARDAASDSETRLWDEFRQKLPRNAPGTAGNEPGLPGAAPA